MDERKYKKLIKCKEYTKLYNYYSQETYWEITGVARSELAHSSFLKWLLDVNGSHNLGDLPFILFLKSLCLAKDSELNSASVRAAAAPLFANKSNIFSDDNKALLEEIKKGAYTVEQGEISCEHQIGKTKKRADIYIVATLHFNSGDKNIVFCIENKVTSTENKRDDKNGKEIWQTEYYFEKLSKDINDIKDTFICPVFLTPFTDDRRFPKSGEFIAVDYQLVLENTIEPLIKKTRNNHLINSRLKEYRRCLGPQSATFKEAGKSSAKDAIAMAVTDFESKNVQALLTFNSMPVLTEIFNSLNSEKTDIVINESDIPFWIKLRKLYYYLLVNEKLKLPSNNEESQFENAVKDSPKGHTVGNTVYVFNNVNGEQEMFKSHGSGSLKTLALLAYRMIEKYASNAGISFDELNKKAASACESKVPLISKAEYDSLNPVSANDRKKLFRLKDYFVGGYPNVDELNKILREKTDYNAITSPDSLNINGDEYYVYRWWSEPQVNRLIKALNYESEVNTLLP